MNTRSSAIVLPGAWGQGKPRSGYLVEAGISLFLRLLLTLVVSLTAVVASQAQGSAPASGAAGGQSAWEGVAKVIVSPWMTIALLVVGCLLLFIDLLTLDTWGLAGTLGVLAVGAVFAAHVTVGGAGWIGVVLCLAGLAFLLLETHVVPGHGLAGVIGLLFLFVGMFYTLGGSENALFALSVSTILTAASLIGFFAYLPRSPVWKKLGQQMQQRASLGYVTSDNMTHFLGRTGKSTTTLRPAGLAEIDGIRVDVVTEGEFLEPGTPIIVIKVEGSRVVVDEEAQAAAAGEEASGTETRAA